MSVVHDLLIARMWYRQINHNNLLDDLCNVPVDELVTNLKQSLAPLCRRRWSEIDIQFGHLQSMIYEIMEPVKQQIRHMIPHAAVSDTRVDTLFWMVYVAIYMEINRKPNKPIDTLISIHSSLLSDIIELFLEGPFDIIMETVYKKNRSAVLIQRTWRRAVADPTMKLCKRRLTFESQSCKLAHI
jgi:hypothetical protein